MKTRKIRILIHLAVLGLLIASCSAEDGATGPIGPAGPQGEQGTAGTDGADGVDGADGTNGEQGDQGDTGTANVIYSDWIDSEFDANITDPAAGIDLEAPGLTQEIIDQGTILVYGRNIVLPSNEIFPLPQIISNDNHGFRVDSPENIRLTISSLDGSAVGSRVIEDYRYILIPGGNPAGGPGAGGGLGSKGEAMDYTKMSYQEVMQHFNIQE